MNFIDFENDTSIICKAYSLKLNRNIKNITLLLLYHISYEVIEIKIYEISSNKLIGREILTYDDIFEIFENYFLCFNEDMLKIYTFLNNCFLLQKYQANINESTKQINISLFLLKERVLNTRSLNITTCEDLNGYRNVLQKIKELNCKMNNNDKTYKIAPVNYIRYENDLYYLYADIFVEKEIDILGIKVQVIQKIGENNIINYINNESNEFYAVYFTLDELNIISKNYFKSLTNLEEISKEFEINFSNKNIKIEGITKEKIKLKIKVLSSAINISDIDLTLKKNEDIKEKYIEIIQDLREKNEYLIKREILQDKKPNKINKNNSIVFNYSSLSSSYNSLNKEGILNNSNISSENKLIGKKKKRGGKTVNKTSKIAKKKILDKNEKKDENAQKSQIEFQPKLKNENVNINEINYNELFEKLIKQEREKLANISKHLNAFD